MNNKFKLTNNEKEVLRKIIEQGRVSDTEMSKEMKVSQQAVFQIRKRLENLGVIKGYMPIIDFDKLGIKMFYFAAIKVLPSLWKKMSEIEIEDKLCKIPFLFMAFRIPTEDISYLLVFGFKSIEAQEKLTKKMESELAGKMRITWSYNTSVKNMIVNNSINLVYHALEKGCTHFKESIEDIKK
ncbi:MAG: hypothetical protein PHV16_05235 [Candidatus Nanoarchaeia archaeon]|nr:hypothetical protein [Candidatus Nanoarchaeia archaeon]